MRFFQIVILSLLMTGCVAQKSITEQGIAFNKALSDFNNKQLLLNIARASRREPMVFTAYSKFSDSQTTQVKGGLGIAKLFDGGESYSTSPAYTRTTKPVFDMAPLDSKEFAKLIADPVNVKQLKTYFDSGWPDGLIISLFVNSITMEENGKVVVYKNHPSDTVDQLGAFGAYVSERDFSICTRMKRSKKTIPVKKDWDEHIESFIALHEKGYAWEVDPKNSTAIRLEREYTEYFLCSKLKGNKGDRRAISFDWMEAKGVDKVGDYEIGSGEVRLRSIEGALYFLGEILRNRKSPGNCVKTTLGGKRVPLFAAERFPAHAIPWIGDVAGGKGSECNDPYGSLVLTVRDGNYVYAIVGDEEGISQGRSMHALSLISQLIALNKAPDLLIAPQTLRLE